MHAIYSYYHEVSGSRIYIFLLRIINFGVTTDTFTSLTSPTALTFPEDAVSEEDKDRPALVFINAVDPNIPIVSNNTDYSNTMPTRQKTQRVDLFQASFDTSSNTEDIPFKMEIKASKSTGVINNPQPLVENLQLKAIGKQKANTSCLPSPVYDAPKITETSTKVADIKPKVKENDGYVFMEPTGKLSDKQFSSKFPQSPHDSKTGLISKQPSEGQTESALPQGISEVSSGYPAVDTSHYDVPRKLLLEMRGASLQQESAMQPRLSPRPQQDQSSLKDQSKAKAVVPPKMTQKPPHHLQGGKKVSTTESSIYDVPRTFEPFKPNFLEKDERLPNCVDEHHTRYEGIYDVPRSVPKQGNENGFQSELSDGSHKQGKPIPKKRSTQLTKEPTMEDSLKSNN